MTMVRDCDGRTLSLPKCARKARKRRALASGVEDDEVNDAPLPQILQVTKDLWTFARPRGCLVSHIYRNKPAARPELQNDCESSSTVQIGND